MYWGFEMLVVVDLETDGLDEVGGHVFECTIKNIHPETLEVLKANSTLVLHPVMPALPPTVREMHTESGLLEALRKAHFIHDGRVIGHRGLDIWLADHFVAWRAQPASILLSGMSVQFDRRWLNAHCPLSLGFLSHRMIDLSTVRELCRFWAPLGCPQLPKEDIAHRSEADCDQAIRAIKWYQSTIFVGQKSELPLGHVLMCLEALKKHSELKRFLSVAHDMRRGAPDEETRSFNTLLCDLLGAL
jgi:oligoribonuclease